MWMGKALLSSSLNVFGDGVILLLFFVLDFIHRLFFKKP
jgi:hypothetical protein